MPTDISDLRYCVAQEGFDLTQLTRHIETYGGTVVKTMPVRGRERWVSIFYTMPPGTTLPYFEHPDFDEERLVEIMLTPEQIEERDRKNAAKKSKSRGKGK